MSYRLQFFHVILFLCSLIINGTLFILLNHYRWIKFIKNDSMLKLNQRNIKWVIFILDLICFVLLIPSTFPIDLDLIIKSLKGLSFAFMCVMMVWFFLHRRNRELVEARNFYKIFKYIFTQLDSGALLHQTFKTVYHVVDEPSIKKRLLKFSVMLSQEHQIEDAMVYLNDSFKSDEGRIFNSVMQNIEHNSMTSKGLVNVDQMLFQKYLSSIRAETKKMESQYILLIILFTFQVMLFLMLPLLSQMVESAQNIFR